LSLLPIKKRLENLFDTQISFVKTDRYISKNIQTQVKDNQSNITMLENLRFSDRERANCKRFAKNLSNLADIYINECFATSHRPHASFDAIQSYLPSYAGLHLEQEIKNLSQVLKKPKHPLLLIIGGAKTATKIPVIEKFLPKAEYILLGGVVANTFLKALGYNIGKSKIDKDYLVKVKKILAKDRAKIFLPVDVKLKGNRTKNFDELNAKDNILDLGSKTITNYKKIIKSSQTIIWNGPLGYIEDKRFRTSTQALVKAILSSKAKTVIGGGDTHEVLKNKKIPKNIFISSGGGAMLEFLAGKKLPGIK